ncbi:MAG: DegT/DnrJ/EryC1/StrS family aminotransferase [Endomicrobia bacterium]|nr:DegT/DnrJ/EryC1/StrS family aminotransferase [Endomicrobiia bacterium]
MKIPLIDLKSSESDVIKQIIYNVKNVIDRREFILGKEVKKFEEEFAKYLSTKYVVGVSSCSSALVLSLKSLGISENDYVITTPFTFTSTAEAIIHCKAKILFADIDEKTYNISTKSIESCLEKFGSKVKAIIPVHLYGQPADMNKILVISKKHNLKIIEDAAQAHGAKIKISKEWKSVGSVGDLGCFSFYPTKNLGCYGDGGAIATNDYNLYNILLKMRNHGRVSHYLYDRVGFNARLDNIQASILLIKLKYLDKWNRLRQKIADIYNKELQGVGDIITPYVDENVEHVYHLYVIRTKYRDKLREYLQNNNIGCAVQYEIPLHLQPAYKGLFKKVDNLNTAEIISKEVLSLPIYPGLKITQLEYIIEKIKKFYLK